MCIKPLSSCPDDFSYYNTTDNIIVHRTLYSTVINKIISQSQSYSHPYYLVKLTRLGSPNYAVVGLGGVHHNNPNDIYIPNWLYRNLLGCQTTEIMDTDELYCSLEYDTNDLISIEPVSSCKIKVNIANNIDVDLRSAIENALLERKTLKIGERFEFCIVEFGNIIEEAEIIELHNRSGAKLEIACIELDSEVNLELETITPAPAPVPVPVPAPVPAPVPVPVPVPVPAQDTELTAEERRRLVRESWLKFRQI